jgi:hypothetical protein
MRAVFRLALRQTEGLIGSVIALLGLALTMPDHATMCRRSRTLALPPLRRSADPEPARSISSWTARASNWVAPVSGWLKSTERPAGDPGSGCTSASMSGAVKLSQSN